MRCELLISRLWPVIVLVLASTAGLHAQAQSPLQGVPDAGSIRQQIEPQRALPLPPAAPPKRVAPPPEIQPTLGMTVAVKAFRLEGNTLIGTEQLQAVLASFVGRELGFDGLQSAADAVTAAYRDAGWIVRTYLPEQDVSEGSISLQVLEARFGGVRFEGAASARLMPSEVRAFVHRQQREGAPLGANALDRALLLLDDLPGVSVAGSLTSGAKEGDIDLALQTTDEPWVYGDIGLDNTGSLSTGTQRVTASLNINSPGGRGELLGLNTLHSHGSDYARLALTVPDGHNGLRLGLNASTMRYRLVAGSESILALQIQGSSSSLGVDWNYPLVRARLHNLYFAGGLENKRFASANRNSSPADPKSATDYASNSLRLALSGNRFDEWGGGGANSASVQMLWGQLTDMQAHSQIDTLARRYRKFTYSASRQQTVTPEHSLLLSLQGQQATQVLDSSERFFIGGASSVRAYPVSELGGERGQVLTGEWRWRLPPDWVLAAFVDHGRVVSLPTAPGDPIKRLSLRGHGLSASWQGPMGFNARLTWARRDGTHPQPTDSGTDSDGTRQLDRWWLTASLPF